MFFFKRKATSPSTASSAENQIFNHISRFLGSLEFAHLQFMVKTNQAIFRPQHHHNIIIIIVNLTCWPFIKINHIITTTIVASSPVSLAAKCVHMPRLLHVPLVPLHVSRDVLALLLFPIMLMLMLMLIRRLVPCRRERLSSLFSPPQKTLGPTPPYPAPPSHCVQLSPPSSIQLLRAVCLFSFLTESEHRHEEFRTKRITHLMILG